MKPPRGFIPVWSAIFAGALAVLAYDVVHQAAQPGRLGTEPRSTVTVTVVPSAPVSPASPAPVGRGVPPSPGTVPAAHIAASSHSAAASGLSSVGPVRAQPTGVGPTPPADTAAPSPSEPAPSTPLPLSVTAAVTVPGRGTQLLAARTAITSGAPPFPIGVDATLTLLDLKTSATIP